MAPIVVLATNRGVCEVRGTEGEVAPHGVPLDLLDRLLIARTAPYSLEEMAQILAVRAVVEGVALAEDALAAAADVGAATSLRHAAALLTPAAVLARTAGREEVAAGDLAEAATLFRDARYSARLLTEHADRYLGV